MRMLQRDFEVETRYGGGFVQQINGIAGGREDGRPGRLVLLRQRDPGRATARPRTSSPPATASGGTTTTGARRSDVPAVVGAFPEPFVSGVDGKRLPVRLDCADARRRRLRRGRRAARARPA